MKTNILATAAALSDRALLARLQTLACNERVSTVELIAHLAELDARPALYAAEGFGSLFSYCTHALRLSEDAAGYRISAARACRRFPVILDLLASGEVTLTAVHLLRKHLTSENHHAVLRRAARQNRRVVEALVAELAPEPDVPTSVRMLHPVMARPPLPTAAPPASTGSSEPPGALTLPSQEHGPLTSSSQSSPALTTPPPVFLPPPPPVIRATAPQRYRLQCTIGEQGHGWLRRLQELLRREVPNGDAGVIVEQALGMFCQVVEKKKCGAATRPRSAPSTRAERVNARKRKDGLPPRDAPRPVSREVWGRDGNQCSFVSADGQRCPERIYLEEHHVQAYARPGAPKRPRRPAPERGVAR